MVILNDFNRQFLRCPSQPRRTVSVENSLHRYESLGQKRNVAAAYARHDLMLFVDDDDLFMPWYVRELVETNQLPCWPNTCVKMSGVSDLQIVIGGVGIKGSFLIRESDFISLGKFPWVSSGEDTVLQNRAVERWPECAPERYLKQHTPAYVYRWNNGVHHLCAYSPLDPSIWVDAEAHAHRLVDRGVEPEGEISLSPGWSVDYLSLIKEKL